MLRCIRCGACLNHCPVYQAVGGHAYGWVYSGPMGAVLTPALIGVEKAGASAQRLDLLRALRERLPDAHSAAEDDAPLARARVRAPSGAGALSRGPGALGLPRAPAAALSPGDRASARARCWAGRRAGAAPSARLPLAGGWTADRDMPAPEGRASTSCGPSATAMSRGADPRQYPPRASPRERRPTRRRWSAAARAAGGPDPGARPASPRPSASSSSSPWRRSLGQRRRGSPMPRRCPPRSPIFLARENLPARLQLAPDPALTGLPWETPAADRDLHRRQRRRRSGLPRPCRRRHRRDRHADAGLGAEAPSTLNFLPDTHIVVLSADGVVGALEEAWRLLAAGCRRGNCRARSISSPARRAAPTSSRSCRWARTGRGGCTSS